MFFGGYPAANDSRREFFKQESGAPEPARLPAAFPRLLKCRHDRSRANFTFFADARRLQSPEIQGGTRPRPASRAMGACQLPGLNLPFAS
jgi:hypothetical protein